MSLTCGIVGLPNVGKSTLFNALTRTEMAQAANYPFCTIEPNIGKVEVPDPRLFKLASMANSQKIIPNRIEFVDIAGLVKGASKGEGLGNKFLSHIREVSIIVHVLRCFDDPNITHVENTVDPERDAAIVEMELLLADLESVSRMKTQLERKIKAKDKEAMEQLELLKQVEPFLEKGEMARKALKFMDYKQLKSLNLITSKPILYVCNVGENEIASGNYFSENFKKNLQDQNSKVIIISSKIESEIASLPDEDRKELLNSLNVEESGLDKVIKSSYDLLDLISFFTVGPKEAHGWYIEKNSLAPQAAGKIHTDFEHGFIRAETISYEDYLKYDGESGAKQAGKMRLEGKEYPVQDGDIFHFRFNV